jgi:hypothetical protein
MFSRVLVVLIMISSIILPCYGRSLTIHKSKINTMTLNFQPAHSKPICHKDVRNYLIVTKAGLYFSVFEKCDINDRFLNFWGWDSGEYTTYHDDNYISWALIPISRQ